jgi:hypothetical protein
MTIDIRANVFCSLGPIIEGALSDSYVQDNGLIYCRGSVRLDGLYQPTLGQVVDFGYQKGGWLARFPRRLRVLSSFADPFTRQTQIELGCKLTYLKDYRQRQTTTVGGRQLPTIYLLASNDGTNPIAAAARGFIPQSIGVNYIINTCLTALGITAAAALPFAVRFNGSKFQSDVPYVQMIDEILKSAAYIGYLNESEQLVIRDLTVDNGTGPVIGRDDIISMEPVGVGELANERMVVDETALRYSPGSLAATGGTINAGSPQDPPGEPPLPPDDPPSKMLWTYDESIGSLQTIRIPYTDGDSKSTYFFSYVPFTYTVTEYDDDNRVASRTTTERTYPPVANGSYWKAALEFGRGIGGSYPINISTVTTYEYNENGDVIREVESRYEPELTVLGKSSVGYTYEASGAQYLFSPSYTANVLSERTTTEYDHWKIRGVSGLGEVRRGSVTHSKTKRAVEKLAILTQEGQQRIAIASEDAATQAEILDLATDMLGAFVLDSVDVQASSQASTDELEIPKAEARPDPDRLLAKGLGVDKSGRKTDREGKPVTASVTIAAGAATDKREGSYSPPYLFEDYYVSDGAGGYRPAGETPQAQLIRYMRIQNRLRLANRAGLSLQLEPNLVPVRPFDPLYINLDGLVGQYRVNGTSWAFTADGIAAQVDAMFWGGVGTV